MSSGRSRGRHARRRFGRSRLFGREVAVVIVVAIVISVLVRVFLVQAFYVPSASMEHTLQIGDRIVSSRVSTVVGGTHRGDVVVFRDPGGWLPPTKPGPTGFLGIMRAGLAFVGLVPGDSGHELVKRVIAVAGDRVQCCDVNGRIIVNGKALDEPYIIGPTDQVHFDVEIGPNRVFVMGDNRGDSCDSRYHLDMSSGGVPLDDVVGKVVLVLWPFSRFATVPVPSIFEHAFG